MSYIVYRCDVCDRELEVELDSKRPDPIRCNITFGCRGKLSRIGVRSAKRFLSTPPVPGLRDFIPRGTQTVATSPAVTLNPITIFTASGDGIITMSLLRVSTSGGTTAFSTYDVNNVAVQIENISSSYQLSLTSKIQMVLFEISPELLISNKYIYVISGPVQIVSGQDDSPEGHNLRFTSANQLSVFVNGIKLDASAYDRSVNDQITFTPEIYDTNNVVEVFVYKDLTSAISTSSHVTLEFKSLVPSIAADLALRNLNCWGDYGSTVIDGVERVNLFCTDLSGLNQDKSYGVAWVLATSAIDASIHTVRPDEIFILLGREPFAFSDKELHAYLTGDTLITGQAVMSYKQSQATGLLQLSVNDSMITQVYDPIKTARRISQTTLTSATTVPGTALEGTEQLKPKYIVGPS